MSDLKHFEVWFVTGSQHLYGEETLRQVDEHARHIAEALDGADTIPVRVVFKSVVTTPEAILQVSRESNGSSMCIGVIAWMHTFSPAKMWISGLAALQKPLLHLHTQFNRELPWDTIDMDFMNLNQSAHGDREFGYITTRLRQSRKIVVGYWDDPAVQAQIAAWTRAAAGWHEAGTLKVVRFGDNMRQVAVTEGDKVEAELKFGFSVNGHGISELVQAVRAVPKAVVDGLVGEYEQHYELAPSLRSGGECRESLREAAQIEAGLRSFLEAAGFKAFTDTFEDLDGLPQLPGIAVQRLMAEGYGFGGEGDWKTAALVRILKVMSTGMTGGTSFMEDYTYHLAPNDEGVLGAHMLEVCPSITNEKPSAQVHPLSIGGKEPPVRLVFTAEPGPAIVVGMLDMGERFRLVTNQVEVVWPEESLPNLPVARALWKPQPDLVTATHAWLLAGGPHHTVFTQALGMEVLEDFAEIAQVELLVIDENTRIAEFKKELRWNRAYYSLARGL